jgi:hypothetical protein
MFARLVSKNTGWMIIPLQMTGCCDGGVCGERIYHKYALVLLLLLLSLMLFLALCFVHSPFPYVIIANRLSPPNIFFVS